MEIIKIVPVIIILIIQNSCSSGDQTEKKTVFDKTAQPVKITPQQKPFSNVHFASKYDTTCGMPLTAGVEETLHLKNKVYGFCSKECKDGFIDKLKAEKKR